MSFIFLRNRVTGGAAFSPASLFSSGEQGAWYEPSTTTCFTDTAGTTAAGVGDAVARINDLSGNGNHATQSNPDARPFLRQTAGGLTYLDFDGADDGMATASIDFTGTDEMSVFVAVEGESGAVIYEFSPSADANNGAFALYYETLGQTYFARVKGSVRQDALSGSGRDSGAVTVLADISGDDIYLRLNGTQLYFQNGNLGTGDFGNHALNIGVRDLAGTPSLWFNGKIYGLIVRGAITSGTDLTNTETYLANRSGVTL